MHKFRVCDGRDSSSKCGDFVVFRLMHDPMLNRVHGEVESMVLASVDYE